MGPGITPAVGGGFVLVQRHRVRGRIKEIPEDAKGLTCYRLTEGTARTGLGQGAGRLLRSLRAPVIVGQRGYAMTRKGLVCIDLATGELVGEPLQKVGDSHCPLMAADGIILAGTFCGSAIRGSRSSARNLPAGREIFTTAFLSAGRVYIRSRLDGYGNRNRAGKTPPEPGCIKCVDLRK